MAGLAPLYAVRRDPRILRRRLLLWVPLALAALLAAAAVLLWRGHTLWRVPPSAWIHLASLALLVAVGPYGFHVARDARRIRLLESRFPDFLRDIASSHRGGMTLPNAVSVAARGEYGPLTPEIRAMADQLSWNVAFQEALARFAERVDTPLVHRAVNQILQADRSGGSTTDVLLAAARDAREIKNLENERRLGMSLYTVVIYVTFGVFLGVAAVLYGQFVPQLVAAQEAVAGSSLQGVQGVGGQDHLRLEDFQLFYFVAAIVQGFGDGILAGMMGSSRAVLGLRHAFAMVLMAYATFAFFL